MREIFDSEKTELECQTVEEKNNSFSVQSAGDKEWRNIQLVPLHSIKCKVPHNILIMMRTIEHQIEVKLGRGKLEFGAFLKGEMKNGALTIAEDILVLRQKVTGTSIDFLEDPPIGYNGIVHRHPSGCTSFSSTDASSVNQNYEFSLLFVNNDITKGIINIILPGTGNMRIQLPLEISIIYPVFSENLDEIVNKIELKQSESSFDVKNRICDSDSNQMKFLDYSPQLNHNPLFDSSEEDESDESENELSTIIDNVSDKLLDGIFECPHCENYEKIEDWPHTCESCGNILQEDECTELEDSNDNDEMQKDKILKLFNRMAEQEKELQEEQFKKFKGLG